MSRPPDAGRGIGEVGGAVAFAWFGGFAARVGAGGVFALVTAARHLGGQLCGASAPAPGGGRQGSSVVSGRNPGSPRGDHVRRMVASQLLCSGSRADRSWVAWTVAAWR